MNLIRLVSEYDVLNKDIRVDNVLVRNHDHHTASCVLIDLPNCRLRRCDESDIDWHYAKVSQDEEGAIGCVTEMKLRQLVGDDVWEYQCARSDKYALTEELDKEMEALRFCRVLQSHSYLGS